MFGIFAASGMVWAEVVPTADAHALRQRLINGHVGRSVAWSGPTTYAAVVDRGHLHPLIWLPTVAGLVGGFWANAQRQLRAKGGIRLERLDLYLAESAWRYNHRRESRAEQLRHLLALTRASRGSSGTFPPRATNPSDRNYFEPGLQNAPKPSVGPTDSSPDRHDSVTELPPLSSVAAGSPGSRRDRTTAMK